MSVKQFAAQFKALIEDIKSKGTAAIYCDNLIAYLNEVQNSPEIEPSPVEIERFKADLQNWEKRININMNSSWKCFVLLSLQAKEQSNHLFYSMVAQPSHFSHSSAT